MASSLYPSLVALTGAKFSGKGTAARFLVDQGYTIVSFARPLKEMLLVLGLTEADLTDPALKETPHDLLCGQTPRWAMQSLGTEWMRRLIAEDGWVNIARHRIKTAQGGVVVDDCRFDNEAIMLHEMGAPIIEIARMGCDYNPAHASEAGISRHLITATVVNDSTIPHLHGQMDGVLKALTHEQVH